MGNLIARPGVLGIADSQSDQKRIYHYLKSQRLHPALLISGGKPEFRFTLAKQMAKVLLCPTPGPHPFCNICSTCRRIEKEVHPDVLVLKDPGDEMIKIDLVRDICHQMTLSPMEADAKICIIEGCHRLNNASANAFLKSLEEPASNRYFWLLTPQTGTLLPTIISRCLTFTLTPQESAPASSEEWTEVFEQSLQSRMMTGLVARLEDKEKCLSFLHYLQVNLHQVMKAQCSNQARSGLFSNLTLYDALISFDEVIKLEGQLRSNANFGLLVEQFMRGFSANWQKENS